MIINDKNYFSVIRNFSALTALHQSIIDGSDKDNSGYMFFFLTMQYRNELLQPFYSSSMSIPEKYYQVILPARLISAVLISVVNLDKSILRHGGFAPALADLLKVCASAGLNYMEENDRDITISAYKAADVVNFTKVHRHLCYDFTNFVSSTSSVFTGNSSKYRED